MFGKIGSHSAKSIIFVFCVLGLSALSSAQESNGKGTVTQDHLTMRISVGKKIFIATMYDNATAKALIERLPLTLMMSELNRKEKYYRLPEDLPVLSTEKPATIHAGEIMCWSSNSLVLFYTTFSNTYGGYVKLGYIEDPSGLAEALGAGNVQVSFQR